MSTERIIGESIDRLRQDYDLALVQAGGDESLVTLYLPGEWVILARRVCEMIISEVTRRERERAAYEVAGPAACTVCNLGLWRVFVDPATQMVRVRCAGCGTACHV